ETELAADVRHRPESDDRPRGGVEVERPLGPLSAVLGDAAPDEGLEAPVQVAESLRDASIVRLGESREDDPVETVLALVDGFVGEEAEEGALLAARLLEEAPPRALRIEVDPVERGEEHRLLVGPDPVEDVLADAAAGGELGAREPPVAELGEGGGDDREELAA